MGVSSLLLFHYGGPYHIETSPLICRANQWTCFYMMGTSVMKVNSCFNVSVLRNIQKHPSLPKKK